MKKEEEKWLRDFGGHLGRVVIYQYKIELSPESEIQIIF